VEEMGAAVVAEDKFSSKKTLSFIFPKIY